MDLVQNSEFQGYILFRQTVTASVNVDVKYACLDKCFFKMLHIFHWTSHIINSKYDCKEVVPLIA